MSIRKFDPKQAPALQVHRWMDEGTSTEDCVRSLIAARDHGLLPGPRAEIQMLSIYAVPYRACVDGQHRDAHCWAFDDPRYGLKEETFLRGGSETIDRLAFAAGLVAPTALLLTLATRPAPGAVEYRLRTNGLLPEQMGAHYVEVPGGEDLWLSPAMTHYLGCGLAPHTLYASVSGAP